MKNGEIDKIKTYWQLLGDLDILSFVRISRWIWIGRINRADNKRKVSQVFNNNPQGIRLRGRPKKNGWWNCVQTDIDRCEIKNPKGSKQAELIGRHPLGRRRSALNCSVIEEEEKEDEEEEKEEEEE